MRRRNAEDVVRSAGQCRISCAPCRLPEAVAVAAADFDRGRYPRQSDPVSGTAGKRSFWATSIFEAGSADIGRRRAARALRPRGRRPRRALEGRIALTFTSAARAGDIVPSLRQLLAGVSPSGRAGNSTPALMRETRQTRRPACDRRTRRQGQRDFRNRDLYARSSGAVSRVWRAQFRCPMVRLPARKSLRPRTATRWISFGCRTLPAVRSAMAAASIG